MFNVYVYGATNPSGSRSPCVYSHNMYTVPIRANARARIKLHNNNIYSTLRKQPSGTRVVLTCIILISLILRARGCVCFFNNGGGQNFLTCQSRVCFIPVSRGKNIYVR